MSASAITTIVSIMETLPDPIQDQVAVHLREYLLDLQDELQWDEQFAKSKEWLGAEADRVRREIDAGRAEPMDLDRL